MTLHGLDQLKQYTKVVADTAQIALIDQYKPTDATTNPSLVFQGFQMDAYQSLVQNAIAFGQSKEGTAKEQIDWTMDQLTVNFGCELLKHIPGRVSTEVDARLSFDTKAMVDKAHRLIDLYQCAGFGRDRVYIKLAATWQGIEAARILESEGIACNLTLLFSFAQAVACAQANVSLISPFVGRILDWHVKQHKRTYTPHEDPGVCSVQRIYNYYKKYGYTTIIMGASFRNKDQILQLAGCDNLTISPTLLHALMEHTEPVTAKLSIEKAMTDCQDAQWDKINESKFLFEHNQDTMAVHKLSEGIVNFNKDTEALRAMLMSKIYTAGPQ